MRRKRVAFVIGGAGGIGEGICRALAQSGYSVAIGYKTSQERAERLAEEIGGGATAVLADVCDYGSLEHAKSHIEKTFGKADTLIFAAGSEAYRLFSDETPESIRQTVACNLTGAMLAARVFSPAMVEEKFGRIVFVSSVWGICGAAMETVYSATKAGVIGFCKALAWELAPSGITVNTVSPGFIDTAMNARFGESVRADILEEIPACRFGLPADVASAVLYLTSEDASYVTGQNIAVTGGYKNV